MCFLQGVNVGTIACDPVRTCRRVRGAGAFQPDPRATPRAAKRSNNPPPTLVAAGTVPRPPEGGCRYTHVVFAGLSFDAAAQSELEEYKDMKVKPHLAHIRPGVNPETAPLLKEQQGSQLFTVFALPRIRVSGPNDDGEYQVTMEGVDIYNPVDNSIQSTKADKMTAWCLDAEYDGKTFFLT